MVIAVGKTRILVAENEAIVAEDIKLKLERFGYEVPATASSGEEAVELAADVHPDLVLMDIRMPGKMDGVDAAVKIKKMCDIPVVFVSAFADKETLDRAKIAEPVGFIIKPFIELELQKTVEIALYGYGMEMKLRQSEAKYRALVENINDIVFSVDAEGIVTFINPVVEQIVGYKPEELVGQPFARFIYPPDLPMLMKQFLVVLAGTIGPDEYRLVTKIGEIRWVRSSSRPIIENGKAVGIQGVATDITERKQSDEALRASEARFSTVFRSSPISIAISRVRDNRLVVVNPAWEKITGYTPEESIGKTAIELGVWGDKPGDRDRFVATLREQGTLQGYEFSFRRKSGEIAHGLMSAEAIRLGDEDCLLTLALDVTERDQAVEASRRSDAELRAMVAKLQLVREEARRATPSGPKA
jgi:PAS domain S-box-containing protein